jgi:hypothetical protein
MQLAQEWRRLRDTVVVPALRQLTPTATMGASPAASPASAFTRKNPSAQRWRLLVPLLNRYRGDIPLEFLLGWIAVESDARIDVVTALDERGFFQIHPAESKDTRPPLQHLRLSTDPDYSVQAGIQIVRTYANLARRRFPWIPNGSELFWRVVKLQHAMGSGLAWKLLSQMQARGIETTWDAIKRDEVNVGPKLHPLLAKEPGRFGRNVDRVFSQGRLIAQSLSR